MRIAGGADFSLCVRAAAEEMFAQTKVCATPQSNAGLWRLAIGFRNRSAALQCQCSGSDGSQ